MMSSKQHPQSSAAAMASSTSSRMKGSLTSRRAAVRAACASNDVNRMNSAETTSGANVARLIWARQLHSNYCRRPVDQKYNLFPLHSCLQLYDFYHRQVIHHCNTSCEVLQDVVSHAAHAARPNSCYYGFAIGRFHIFFLYLKYYYLSTLSTSC